MLASISKDVGIIVNGVAASISGYNWAVNNVPLTDGANTITVTAKDTVGRTMTKSVTVNKAAAAQSVQLMANITSGAAPLTVNFTARTNLSAQVAKYEIDFEGKERLPIARPLLRTSSIFIRWRSSTT